MNEPYRRRERFPIARRILRLAGRARANWLERHQNDLNYALHFVGIPLTLIGLVFLIFLSWPWALGTFVLGYVLQWLGHHIEGNDLGELIPLKRCLGLKVVPIAPQFQSKA